MSDEKALSTERAPISMGAGGVELRSIEELYRFAKVVIASGLAPKAYQKPEQVMVSVQHGAEVGFGPMQSLQSIAVIGGKPCLMVEPALALVYRSGLLAKNEHKWDLDGEDRYCLVTLERKGGIRVERTFAVRDAKRAGLLQKSGPWQDYTDRMLYARAMGFALRDLFPDVLRGIGIAEEQQDIPPRNVTPPRKALAIDPAVQAIFALGKGPEPKAAVEYTGPSESGVENPPSKAAAASVAPAPASDPGVYVEPAPEAPEVLRSAIWARAMQTEDPRRAAPLVEKLIREKHGRLDGSLADMDRPSLEFALTTASQCRVDVATSRAWWGSRK